MRFISFLLFIVMLCGFAQKPVEVAPAPQVELTPLPPPEVTQGRIPLSWENTTEPHPERAAWSDAMIAIFSKDFDVYSKAKDIAEICPKFNSLPKSGQLKALGEFWVAVAYYESGYKPGQYSVDVGTKNDKETWSVGLYQMSGTDSSAKKFGYNFEALKDPVKNINVALEQLKRQIQNTGLLLLPRGHKNQYWAIILVNGKYQKISQIKARVLKNVPKCG